MSRKWGMQFIPWPTAKPKLLTLDQVIQEEIHRSSMKLRSNQDWESLLLALMKLALKLFDEAEHDESMLQLGSPSFISFCIEMELFQIAASMLTQQSSFWKSGSVVDFLDTLENIMHERAPIITQRASE